MEDNFKKLPTESLMLDEDFKILNEPRVKIEREHEIYYIATCHYVVRGGGKQYYLKKSQIKNLMEMVKDEDPDYPHFVRKAFRYGVNIRELNKK